MAEQAKKEDGAVQATEKKTTKQAKKEGKVYRFKSSNKFLSCTGLGVQFINGEASTSNLEVAKALVKIDGVTLVEE